MPKAGLFSAIGTVSLVESYKWLSPDSGDETVDLLGELVNVTQNIPLTPGSEEQFKRTFDIVTVNILWFASITICVCCGVLATLLQQWVRRYQALAQGGGTKDEREHVQRFLHQSLGRFQLPWIQLLLGMGLHLSIGLYALGILLFIFHVDRHLVVYASVGFSPIFFTYIVLTILPIFFWDSPYSTPFSAPVWCIWWAVNFLIYSGISKLFSRLLPGGWVEYLHERAEKHSKWCMDGLEKTVERHAKDFLAQVHA